MQIYGNEERCLHKKRVRILQVWLEHKHGGRFIVLVAVTSFENDRVQNSQNKLYVFMGWERHISGEAVSSLFCCKIGLKIYLV